MSKNHSSELHRAALVELLNLPDINFGSVTDDERRAPAFALAKRFLDRYGELRLPADPLSQDEAKRFEQARRSKPGEAKASLWAEAELFSYAKRFRQVWTDAERKRFRAAESTLNEILKGSDPIAPDRSGFTTNMEVGAIQAEPTTLLQQLALEFLYSRKSLRRCPECRDFFFVANPSVRRKYCKNALRDCAHTKKNRSQKLLMRRKRAPNAKRTDRKN